MVIDVLLLCFQFAFSPRTRAPGTFKQISLGEKQQSWHSPRGFKVAGNRSTVISYRFVGICC